MPRERRLCRHDCRPCNLRSLVITVAFAAPLGRTPREDVALVELLRFGAEGRNERLECLSRRRVDERTIVPLRRLEACIKTRERPLSGCGTSSTSP